MGGFLGKSLNKPVFDPGTFSCKTVEKKKFRDNLSAQIEPTSFCPGKW